MTVDAGTALGQLVNSSPRAARVLESVGLDYCCGGHRSLADACAEKDIDPQDVLNRLVEVDDGEQVEWAGFGPVELVDHIESTHHRYLHEELPRLVALAQKVASVHGERHPELVALAVDVVELHDDLEPHMMKEERVLFPLIRSLDDPAAGASTMDPAGPISVMMAEHEVAGALLERIRERTGDFAVPGDACASYSALYQGLEAVENDTHIHIHKENNVLFPAVLDHSAEPVA